MFTTVCFIKKEGYDLSHIDFRPFIVPCCPQCDLFAMTAHGVLCFALFTLNFAFQTYNKHPVILKGRLFLTEK